jgi:hypothetical protein
MHSSVIAALLTPHKAEAFFLLSLLAIVLWHFTYYDTSATVTLL